MKRRKLIRNIALSVGALGISGDMTSYDTKPKLEYESESIKGLKGNINQQGLYV